MKDKFSLTTRQRPFPALVMLAAGLLLIMLLAGCNAAWRGVNLTPAPGFQPLAKVDLSARAFDGEILGQFTLAETAAVSLLYTLPRAGLPYFDLSLVGPGDERRVVLHSEDYRTDEHGGGTWEQRLAPGTYRLALTSEPGPGLLSVFWGQR